MNLAMVPVPVDSPELAAFFAQRDMFWLAIRLVILTVPAVLLFTGWGARLAAACSRAVGGRKPLTIALYAAIYVALTWLAVLPLGYVRDLVHPVVVGIPAPIPNPLTWLAERGVLLAIQAGFAALLFWIPFAVIARFPRSWWLSSALLLWLAVCVAVVGEQVVVRPMTTDYQTVAEGPLKARLDDLLARCGAEDALLLVGGHESSVIGLGPTSRIVIQEGGFEVRTEGQALQTVAHELKHYLLHDNWLAFGAVGTLALLGMLAVQLLGLAAIRLWGARFGIGALSEPAALPLLCLLVIALWTFVGQPSLNAVQRTIEVEADRFALEATRDNVAVASWHGRPGGGQPSTYGWFYETFRATHPSRASRVAFANSYRPWEAGETLRYAAFCDPPGEDASALR